MHRAKPRLIEGQPDVMCWREFRKIFTLNLLMISFVCGKYVMTRQSAYLSVSDDKLSEYKLQNSKNASNTH